MGRGEGYGYGQFVLGAGSAKDGNGSDSLVQEMKIKHDFSAVQSGLVF